MTTPPLPPSRGTSGRRRAAALGAFGLLPGLLLACTPPSAAPVAPTPAASASATDAQDSSPEQTPTEPPGEPAASVGPVTFTLAAAGDVLPHATVLSTAGLADGGWDFTPLWAAVTPWVEAADLALCHLEVPIAPDGVTPAGYPVFGSPAALVRDLRASGWDGCSTASNHSLDQGWAGVTATLDAMDAVGLGHVGTARTAIEADSVATYALTRDGLEITVAQLSASWGTNGLPIPGDAPWSIELLDAERLITQAEQARAAGADLVVASLHWGNEYVDEPHATQTELAAALADSGAIDLVIGHHPHVPQPIELLPGGPDSRGMWVAYSLGNFISNQDERCCRMETATGALLWAEVTATGDGTAVVSDVSWTTTTVDRVGDQRVYALADLLEGRIDAPALTLSAEELAERHGRAAAVLGPDLERTQAPSAGSSAVVLPRPR